MRPDDFFKNRIKAKEIKPVTLFLGTEDLWKKLHLRKIRDLYLGEKNESLQFFEFRTSETPPGTVIAEANSFGFFSSAKMIVYQEVDELNAEEQKELLAYAASPNPGTLLILCAESLDGRSALANDPVLKTERVEYDIKGEKDLIPFMEFILKNLGGLKLEKRLQDYLLNAFPRNMRLLSNNIEKMAAHCGFSPVIQMKDAVVLNAEDPEINNFTFVDAVVTGDIKKAFEIKNILLKQKEAVFGLLGALRWQFQNFLIAKEMQKNRESEETICSRCRVSFNKKQNFFGYLNRAGEKELGKRYRMIAECDSALKSSSVSPHHVFEMLLLKICR